MVATLIVEATMMTAKIATSMVTTRIAATTMIATMHNDVLSMTK